MNPYYQDFSRTLRAFLLVLGWTAVVSAQPVPDSLTCPGDSLRIIPCGPVVGSFGPSARVTVADTVAGWAKVYVEGWVPVDRAIPFLNQVRLDSVSARAALDLLPASVSKPSDVRRQCEATTTKGTRCSRKAEKGSRYCWQHKN
ncbi:hypothetical protein HZB60_02510 [candidate division KSB1 bacterium]|nr:hypothetical protein [candidate division KSB1 bacterium]